MEQLEGVPLTDYNAIRSITTRDPEEVLIGALNTWFGSVVACETFHADLHAGNTPTSFLRHSDLNTPISEAILGEHDIC